ncbi:MAG: efflux RND transporter periplasmic adaptor subunit [Spirochaetales bacterium]|nr:efflux RND transporter periplasmic adaptor subunit [Spirochaetales bacterium]
MRTILFFIGISASLLSCHQKQRADSSDQVTQIPSVETYLCTSVSAAETVETYGLVTAAQKADIFPPSESLIKRLFFEEGDEVKEGDILAELDLQQIDLQIREAEVNIESCRTALDLAERKLIEKRRQVESRFYTINSAEIELAKKDSELRRMKEILNNKRKLYEAGGISKDDFLSVELSYLDKESEYEQALCSLAIQKIGFREEDLLQEGFSTGGQASQLKENYILLNTMVARGEQKMSESALKVAEKKLESLLLYREENIIRAPFPGIIVRRFMDEGEKSSRDRPLYHICGSEKLYVSCRLSENELNTIRKNQIVDVFSPSVGTSVSGTVEQISPWIDSDSGQGEVKISINGRNDLFRFGQFVEVKITVNDPLDQMLIPSASVLDESVFLLKGNHIFKRSLLTGNPVDGMLPVLDGLDEGDLIVLNPVRGFRDGMEVAIQ